MAHKSLGEWWEIAAPWLVAVMAVLMVLVLIACLNLASNNNALAQENLVSQNNHHASTVRSNAYQVKLLKEIAQSQADHNKTLVEIQNLQQTVAKAFAEGVPAITAGQNQLVASLNWLECAVASGASKCGPAPTP